MYNTKQIIKNIQGEINWCQANMNEWGDDYSTKEKKAFMEGLQRVIELFKIADKQI